jgi:hypothetical protein
MSAGSFERFSNQRRTSMLKHFLRQALTLTSPLRTHAPLRRHGVGEKMSREMQTSIEPNRVGANGDKPSVFARSAHGGGSP